MVSRPTSPSCLEPALPTQTTLHRWGLGISSSRTSSTTWPRLIRWKLPRSRKPSFEESRARHGSLFGLRSRLMTNLARLFDSTRFERRALKTGKLGIPPCPRGSDCTLDSVHLKCETRVAFCVMCSSPSEKSGERCFQGSGTSRREGLRDGDRASHL